MEYTTKRCPHCKYAYSIMEPKGGVFYGSPIRICERCGNTFIDNEYREIAVNGIRKADTKRIYPNSIARFIFFSFFFLVGLYLLYLDGLSDVPDTPTLWYLIITSILLIVDIYFLIIEYREYDERQCYLAQERKESEERLSNIAYAHFLKEIGYDVPEKYLVPKDDNEY